MISRLRAVLYAMLHPGQVELVVVRRYPDAQGRFIGELYLDNRMIGMSCDTMPFDAMAANGSRVSVEFDRDFLAPMAENRLRVGSMEPGENEAVRRRVARMRYCDLRISVMNRFVEHVIGAR